MIFFFFPPLVLDRVGCSSWFPFCREAQTRRSGKPLRIHGAIWETLVIASRGNSETVNICSSFKLENISQPWQTAVCPNTQVRRQWDYVTAPKWLAASLMWNRKYQACLMFTIPCWTASTASANEKERTGKRQQSDVAYVNDARGRWHLLSAACWRCRSLINASTWDSVTVNSRCAVLFRTNLPACVWFPVEWKNL